MQGNLDPTLVFAPTEVMTARAGEIIEAGRAARGHVFNLGHGVLPSTDPDQLKRLTEFVQGYSLRLRRLGGRDDVGVRRRSDRTSSSVGMPTSASTTSHGSSAPSAVARPTAEGRQGAPARAQPGDEAGVVVVLRRGLLLLGDLVDADDDRGQRGLVGEVRRLLLERLQVGLALRELRLDRHDVADALGLLEEHGDPGDAALLHLQPGLHVDHLGGDVVLVGGRRLQLADVLERPRPPCRSPRTGTRRTIRVYAALPSSSDCDFSSVTCPAYLSTTFCTSICARPTSSARSATLPLRISACSWPIRLSDADLAFSDFADESPPASAAELCVGVVGEAVGRCAVAGPARRPGPSPSARRPEDSDAPTVVVVAGAAGEGEGGDQQRRDQDAGRCQGHARSDVTGSRSVPAGPFR